MIGQVRSVLLRDFFSSFRFVLRREGGVGGACSERFMIGSEKHRFNEDMRIT